jgi:WD40 repeat protein
VPSASIIHYNDILNALASPFFRCASNAFCFRNVYSKEMIQSIPVVNDIKELKHEHQLESIHVGDGGLRCLAFSWDGRRIASGDRGGNLRVHNTDSLKCVSFTEAHDAEILSLDYAHVNGTHLFQNYLFYFYTDRATA